MVILNGKVINKREIQLIKLMDEHNQTAIEVHQFNLMMRRSLTVMFIAAALTKVMLLYILIKFNNL